MTGVTIATRLGVAGIVWKQNDKYWLRGVPVAENGSHHHPRRRHAPGLRPPPVPAVRLLRRRHRRRQPRAARTRRHRSRLPRPAPHHRPRHRRPELGPHHLARLLSPPGQRRGPAFLRVGRGRPHRQRPAGTRAARRHPSARRWPPTRPGPAREIGLLSSPTAVAVTNPGIVIVLEAGASQLAAFDLNGNPVRYFGTASPADFTLPLPTPPPTSTSPSTAPARSTCSPTATTAARSRTTASTSTPPTARRSPPTAPAPTSPTSPSTTGAASTRPTTRRCSTAARAASHRPRAGRGRALAQRLRSDHSVMTGPRAACLILALAAILVLAVPDAAVGASCTVRRTFRSGSRPLGGAVLWSSTSDPTIPTRSCWASASTSDVTRLPGSHSNPWAIPVAPGAALVFLGHDTEIGHDLARLPVGSGERADARPAPIDVNPRTWGRWQYWGTTTGVAVVDPADPAEQLRVVPSLCHATPERTTRPDASFRACPTSVVGFVGQVTGATLVNVELQREWQRLRLQRLRPQRLHLRGSLERATFNNVTVPAPASPAQFEPGATSTFGAQRSTRCSSARSSFPSPYPRIGRCRTRSQLRRRLARRSFPAAGEGFRCTSFANTNLVLASFVVADVGGGCTGAPLFPDSQIALAHLRRSSSTPTPPRAVDLSGATVVASADDRAALAGADLSGVNLSGVEFLGEASRPHRHQVRRRQPQPEPTSGWRAWPAPPFQRQCRRGLLQLYADLSGDSTHSGANFSGPHTNLQGANFVNANVSGAKFVGADISRRQLHRGPGRRHRFQRRHGTRRHLFPGPHLRQRQRLPRRHRSARTSTSSARCWPATPA